MPTSLEYITKIRGLKWPGIKKLWNDVDAGKVESWWEPGKAFEYLVVRMFELDGADVTWPYLVYLGEGPATEQIDGVVRIDGMYWLIESKDEKDKIAVDPIAKLRNQLLRRPWGTVGLVFTTTKFTSSAIQLTQFALPQPILLWTGAEISCAIEKKKICDFARSKYRICVEHGIVDWNIAAREET